MDFAHYKILYVNDLVALAISSKLILFIYIWVGTSVYVTMKS